MSEQTIDLGGGRFGVLHLPERPAPILFVLPNAGAVHRQGPFRLYVHLARRLAALGIGCFRFDQPGIGDALSAAERPQQALLIDVLDRLVERTGCQGFVVGGICSAADAGWRLALVDARVRGLLLLDPVAYGSSWFRWARLLRLRSPAVLLKAVRRRLGRRRDAASGGQATAADYRDWPSAAEAPGQLAQLCARGVEVLALYTGGVAHYFLHPRQFAATFGVAARAPRVHCVHWPAVDHLFYRPVDRERLLDQVCSWAGPRFAGSIAALPERGET